VLPHFVLFGKLTYQYLLLMLIAINTAVWQEDTRKAREYAAWKKWWKSTISTADYLEYVSSGRTNTHPLAFTSTDSVGV
jgi:hypothetical protein